MLPVPFTRRRPIGHMVPVFGTTLSFRHKKGVAPTASADQFHALARRIIDDADAAKNLFRKPSTRRQLTLGLMRTLDMPRTIALSRPLTGTADVALVKRQVGLAHSAARPPSEALQSFIAGLPSQLPKTGRAERLGKPR